MLTKWKQQDVISNSVYYSLNFSNPTLPRAYGVPKVHKTGYLLRIIISTTGSPLHSLASYLHKIIYTSLPHPAHIDNSFHLVKNIFNVKISNDSVLLSLDMVSMFTNVPVGDCGHWKQMGSHITKHDTLQIRIYERIETSAQLNFFYF